MPAAPDIDAYIDAAPVEQRAALQQLREHLVQLIPDAGETISYQIPTMTYCGKALLAFGSRKGGCSLYLMSGSASEALSEALIDYEVRGSTVWFTPSKPLNMRALKRIVAHRVAEVDARQATRR